MSLKWKSEPNLLPTGEQSPFSSIGGILPPVGNPNPSLGPLLPKLRLLESKTKEPAKPTLVHEPVWEPIPNSSQAFAICSRAQHTLYYGARGPGKALPTELLVPVENGWSKHGDLKIGDKVYSSFGDLCNVIAVFEKQVRDVYKFTFNDGSTIESSDNHLWEVSIDYGTPENWRILDTLEIRDRVEKDLPVRIPKRPALEKEHFDFGMDPYMLGLWIGDGSAYVRVRKPTGNRTKERLGYVVEFGSNDQELVEAAIDNEFSVRRKVVNFTWMTGKQTHKNALINLGLFDKKSHSKFIPKEILQNSFDVRLAFLQGYNDTDGCPLPNGGSRITTVSKQLAEDLISLVQSLGGVARLSQTEPSEKSKAILTQYNVHISFEDIVPFRLNRKIEKYSKPERLGWFCLKVVSCEFVGEKEVSCIEVDSENNLYVAGKDHIVTHNTITQLMKFRSRVGLGYGSYWRGVIFDREFKHLSDLVAQSNRFFPKFNDGCRWLKSATEYMWEWPTGEQLLFRHVKKIEDYEAFHGHEYAFIGWNELTKYPTLELYDKFMSVNRSSFDPVKHTPKIQVGQELVYDTPDKKPLPPIPLEVFSTTNPHGPGHNAVKKRFIDPARPGEIVRKKVTFHNNLTNKDITVERTQVAIFGSFYENPYLPDEYRAELLEICEKDPALKAAWIGGSWDVSSGGAVDDLWSTRVHVVSRFKVPSGWKVDRSFDWGSTHPFATVWWAEANGEEIELADGSTWCPNRGSLIAIDVFYGTDMIGTNKGIKMSAENVAKEINVKEKILTDSGWISSKVQSGPADNQIRNVTDSGTDTIETIMAKEGVRWTPSDKSPGSRIIGLQLFRDRLEAAIKGQKPAIYFTRNCSEILEIIPSLSRDPDKPDDIDTESEDHLWDAIRYRVLKGSNKWATKVKTNWAC